MMIAAANILYLS